MANALRVGAVDTIGDALVFLGKLSVMAGAGETHPLKVSDCLWLISTMPLMRQPGAGFLRKMGSADTCHMCHACMSCRQCQQHHALAPLLPHVKPAALTGSPQAVRTPKAAEMTPAMHHAGVTALLMSDLPFYTDPTRYPDTYLSSPLLPVILSLLIGYIVASVFFDVSRCPTTAHATSSPEVTPAISSLFCQHTA